MYKSTSPWYKTGIIGGKVLDVQTKRYLYKDPFDVEYIIETKYDRRPDLYSYDIYGTSKWWWIFAERNPNIIKDPINDFKAGVTIYVPSSENLDKMK